MEKNQFECPRCKEVLTSTSNYDLQKCSCGASAIDGGENLRIIQIDATDFNDAAFNSIDWNCVANNCSDHVNDLEGERKKHQKEKDQD